jgi:hypothetical protein
MHTALDADPSLLDQQEKNFVAKIREHGWFGTNVGADDEGPGFSYTTGFWLNLKFPEIIIFSLSGKVAHDTFWYIYKELKAGGAFEIGEPTDTIFESSQAVLLDVNTRHFPEFLGWSRWFYGSDSFKCLQLVWPDREGRFPWDPAAAEEFVRSQPCLTGGEWSSLRRH